MGAGVFHLVTPRRWRSAVRNFRRAGISETDAMRLSGHKTAAMLKRYSITAPKDLEEAVAKLAKVTGGQG
jgi:hypothetical protein